MVIGRLACRKGRSREKKWAGRAVFKSQRFVDLLHFLRLGYDKKSVNKLSHKARDNFIRTNEGYILVLHAAFPFGLADSSARSSRLRG